MSAFVSCPFQVGIVLLYVLPLTVSGPLRPLTITAIMALGSGAVITEFPASGGKVSVPCPVVWWHVAQCAAKSASPLIATGSRAAATWSVETAGALLFQAER